MPLLVRPIPAAEHAAFGAELERSGRPGEASFKQSPSWGGARPGWVPSSVGWYDGTRLVAAGLVVRRRLPVVGASLAYLPEGPVLPWSAYDPVDLLRPLLDLLRRQRAFGVTIGPPVVRRRWSAATVRDGLRAEGVRRLGDLPPDEEPAEASALVAALRSTGWEPYDDEGASFGGARQPRFGAVVACAGATEDDLRARLDSPWRRNLRRADAAGVQVRDGTAADWARWQPLYEETAARDGFAPMPAEFFPRVQAALDAECAGRMRLVLAVGPEGEALSAAVVVRAGSLASYVYGASSTAGRPVRASNALHWHLLREAARTGASAYDLRGVSDTLELADPLVGLTRFKVGLGADLVEHVGEWTYALRPLLSRAVSAYLDRRSR